MAAVACTAGGTDLRDEAKFCDECGYPTAAPASRAEYKQVTVLFARYVEYRDRYREMARRVDFKPHIRVAEAMP